MNLLISTICYQINGQGLPNQQILSISGTFFSNNIAEWEIMRIFALYGYNNH